MSDNTLPLIMMGLIVTATYFLPFIVAQSRRHVNVTAIAVLNLLLGWTCIGWIMALVWACTVQPERGSK